MKDNYSSKQVNNRDNTTTSKGDGYEWGKHPNSQKAIKEFQYKKGMSGNPEGRTSAFDYLRDALNEVGDKVIVIDDDIFANAQQITYREKVLTTIWNRAMDGDFKYIELLAKLGCLKKESKDE